MTTSMTPAPAAGGVGVTNSCPLQDGPPGGRAPQAAPAELAAACRLIALHHDGAKGVWAYEAFDFINAAYFGGVLPTPLIRWALTPHGRCLGYTRVAAAPEIALHPSLLGGTEKPNPWGVSPAELGVAYAFDTLLHECIHVQNHWVQGGWHGTGATAHNNPLWVGEVNRLVPLLGFAGVRAGTSGTKRVPVAGKPTTRGKPPTKVIRDTAGTVPFGAVAAFPSGVRRHLGLVGIYLRDELPFEPTVLPGGSREGACNGLQHVTEGGER